MKKFILVLILLFTIVSTACAKELQDYSIDELIAFKTYINQELMNRGAMKSADVPTGTYIIGQDIPVGDYSVSTNSYMVIITINDYESMYTLTQTDGVGKISLKEGQKFETSGSITLTKYSGLNFN